MPFHVLARRTFDLFFIGRGLADGTDECLIPVAHVGTNNNLKLPGVGKAAFDHRQRFDGFWVGFVRCVQDKTQAGDAMTHRSDVFTSAD